MRPVVPALGELARHPDVPEWWESRPVSVPFFGEALRFVVDHEPADPSASYPRDVGGAVASFLALGVYPARRT